tara:strand:- start:592 stop:936 length:345 start_codon:yes stop_codon:yes gene_type:complete
MTAEIFDFGLERAKRKSGLNNSALLKDMVKEGYDPCDPIDIQNYYEWQNFQNVIYNDVDTGNNWTDEALDRLFEDIKNFDPTKTYTVEYNLDEIKELVIDSEDGIDFTHLTPTK